MREVRGDGVAYSTRQGEALANRRYGIKGGVSVGGSRTGDGSVEERRPRPFPSSSSRLGSAGSPVSEKNSSRKLAEQTLLAYAPVPYRCAGVWMWVSENKPSRQLVNIEVTPS